MRSVLTILLALTMIAACAVPRTPVELKQTTPPISYSFAMKKSEAVQCLVPELDKITPFNFPPDETRVPSVRELGDKTQVIAMDEDIALYVIEIEAVGEGARASAHVNSNYPIGPQITRAATICRGQPAT